MFKIKRNDNSYSVDSIRTLTVPLEAEQSQHDWEATHKISMFDRSGSVDVLGQSKALC